MAFVLAAWLFLVGLYGIVTSRNLVHLVVCLGIVQSSTYVLLLEVGFRGGGTAPIYFDVNATKTVDPVVQALVLTDVVIGVTVAALLLALAVQVHKKAGTLDPSAIRPMAG